MLAMDKVSRFLMEHYLPGLIVYAWVFSISIPTYIGEKLVAVRFMIDERSKLKKAAGKLWSLSRFDHLHQRF